MNMLRRQSLQCSWISQSGTVSRTCNTAASESRWRHFYLDSKTEAQSESPI